MKEGLSANQYYDIARDEAETTRRCRQQSGLLRWAYLASKHTKWLTATDKRAVLSVIGEVGVLAIVKLANNDAISFGLSEGLAFFGGALSGATYRPVSRGSEMVHKIADKFSKNVLKIDNTKKLFKEQIRVEDIVKHFLKFSDVVSPEEVRKWIKKELSQSYEGDSRKEVVQIVFQRNLEQRRQFSPKKEASARRKTVDLVMEAQALAQVERRSTGELIKEAFWEAVDVLGTAVVLGAIGTWINMKYKAYVASGLLGLWDEILTSAPIIGRVSKKGISRLLSKVKNIGKNDTGVVGPCSMYEASEIAEAEEPVEDKNIEQG